MLKTAGIENASFEAAQLLFSVLGIDNTRYYLSQNKEITENDYKKFISLLERRKKGEPLQYILGIWDFYGSEFIVGNGVLIPRPETEELADICINEIRSKAHKVVYDLCAGSGCLGITIAKKFRDTECYLFEYIDKAYTYTEKNIKAFNLSNVHLIKSNVLTGEGSYDIPRPDLIVSNPPYIDSDEIPELQAEVQFEPKEALDGGKDGLDFYRAIANIWIPKLNNNGFAVVECGENQSNKIKSLFQKYLDTVVYIDMYGCPRFVAGRKKEEKL